MEHTDGSQTIVEHTDDEQTFDAGASLKNGHQTH
jgi:hypothetical protein